MPSCILKYCTNRSSCKSSKQEAIEEGRKISFHRVSKNIVRCRSWLKNLEIHESDVPKDAVVCSVHFVSDDYDRTCPSCIRLKSHAIPYVLKQEFNNDSDVFAEPLEEIQRCESATNSECLVLKQEFNNDSNVFAEPLKKIPRCESATNSECKKFSTVWHRWHAPPVVRPSVAIRLWNVCGGITREKKEEEKGHHPREGKKERFVPGPPEDSSVRLTWRNPALDRWVSGLERNLYIY